MSDRRIDRLLDDLDEGEKENALHRLIDQLDAPGRTKVFQKLLPAESIHVFEERVGARAAVILEAMHRASAFTVRGIEGVIAEAVFALEVLPTLSDWTDKKPAGEDHPFDFDLYGPEVPAATTAGNRVRIQVKMQRRQAGVPMTATQAFRRFAADMWVVETQKSRKGEKGGASTRPYRFGEFDILAVSMRATKGKWSNYMYTVANWLIPAANAAEILKFQPIPSEPNADWTDDFLTVVEWLRSGVKKTIGGCAVPPTTQAAKRRAAKPRKRGRRSK